MNFRGIYSLLAISLLSVNDRTVAGNCRSSVPGKPRIETWDGNSGGPHSEIQTCAGAGLGPRVAKLFEAPMSGHVQPAEIPPEEGVGFLMPMKA